MTMGRRLVAGTFIIFLVFGVLVCAALSSSGMESGGSMQGMMSLCPMDGGSGPCQSGIDRIDHWLMLFSGIPAFFLFALAFLSTRFLPWLFKKIVEIKLETPYSVSMRHVLLPPPVLQEAFSSGILNPKTF